MTKTKETRHNKDDEQFYVNESMS